MLSCAQASWCRNMPRCPQRQSRHLHLRGAPCVSSSRASPEEDPRLYPLHHPMSWTISMQNAYPRHTIASCDDNCRRTRSPACPRSAIITPHLCPPNPHSGKNGNPRQRSSSAALSTQSALARSAASQYLNFRQKRQYRSPASFPHTSGIRAAVLPSARRAREFADAPQPPSTRSCPYVNIADTSGHMT